MNNFWRCVFLVAGSIFMFWMAIFRPEYLKSIRRGGSKYHMSRLGAASCGVLLLAIGIAGILNGLAMLSGVYVRSVFWLAITQLLAVGFYDTYRKWRLGSHSPFYVKPLKNENRDKNWLLFSLVTVALIVVFALTIHSIFPKLDAEDLKFYAKLGLILLIFAIFFVMNWRLKRTLNKFHKEKKKALDRIGANDENEKG